MGCVIDHLQSHHRIRVLRDFRDARGTARHAGDVGVLRVMDLDWARQEFSLEWERDGGREKLFFRLDATEGPRSGRMREYFALEERAPIPRPSRKELRRLHPVVLPPVREDPVTDPADYSVALERVWALAARQRFEEAEQQIQLILAPPDPYSGRLERLAGDLVATAITHADDEDLRVYDWLSRRATSLWYAYGSGASSGGEGAVRAERIHAAETELARWAPERD